MITWIQLICHIVGDYFIQSDWMATNKAKRNIPCFAHALFYTLVFLFITRDWAQLAVIGSTHYLIDRYSVAKYLVYAHNFIAPCFKWDLNPKSLNYLKFVFWRAYPEFKYCQPFGFVNIGGINTKAVAQGHPEELKKMRLKSFERPHYIQFVVYLIFDNTLHILINGLALTYVLKPW